jgi:S-adenosylmethionine:tRNA ribosyltransferase-isomerase
MIAPGFRYRIVQRIITNFHQPQSTLLLLVAAAVGKDRWRGIYDHALESDYRFLSYGDACLIEVEPYTQSPQ